MLIQNEISCIYKNAMEAKVSHNDATACNWIT